MSINEDTYLFARLEAALWFLMTESPSKMEDTS